MRGVFNMAKRKDIDQELLVMMKRYKKVLVTANIRPEFMAVFGSQVKGTAKPYSDIDVCIVSKDLSADPVDDYVRLSMLADKVDDRIEPHGFLPEDFDPTMDSLAYEVKRTGVVI